MATRLPAIALGLLVAAPPAIAPAQLVPFPPGHSLSQDDIDRMQAASARLYEGRSIGSVERWRNPVTDDAGEATLARSFEMNGMPCRTIDYTVAFATDKDYPDHFTLNLCRVQDGRWMIVQPPGSE